MPDNSLPLDGSYQLGALLNLEQSERPTGPLTDLANNIEDGSYWDLIANTGSADQANQLLQAASQGQVQNLADTYYTDRTAGELAQDAASNFAQGAVGAVGGLLSLATSPIRPLSSNISEDTSNILEGLQKLSSENSRRQARAREAALSLREEASRQLYDTSTLEGGLAAIGRDVINTVDYSIKNPGSIWDLGFNAAGSTLSAFPLAIGTRTVGNALLRALGSQGLAQSSKVPVIIANALAEGGGGYQSGREAVMELDTNTLMKSSQFRERFNKYKNQGMNNSQALQAAKDETAHIVGLQSAAASGIAGAISGPLSDWIEAPFSPRSFGNMISNVAGETFGESAIEGFAPQIAQNLSVKENANPEQNLVEGVGRNIAESALGAFASTGAMQSPRAIAHLGSTARETLRNRTQQAEQVPNSVIQEDTNKVDQALSTKNPGEVQQAADDIWNDSVNFLNGISENTNLSQGDASTIGMISNHLNGLAQVYSAYRENIKNIPHEGLTEEPTNNYQEDIASFGDWVQQTVDTFNNSSSEPAVKKAAAQQLMDIYSFIHSMQSNAISNKAVKENLKKKADLFDKAIKEKTNNNIEQLLEVAIQSSVDEVLNEQDLGQKNRAILNAWKMAQTINKPELVDINRMNEITEEGLDDSDKALLHDIRAFNTKALSIYNRLAHRENTKEKNTITGVWRNATVTNSYTNNTEGKEMKSILNYLYKVREGMNRNTPEGLQQAVYNYNRLKAFTTHLQNKVNAVEQSRQRNGKESDSRSAWNPRLEKWYGSNPLTYSKKFADILNDQVSLANSAVDILDQSFPSLKNDWARTYSGVLSEDGSEHPFMMEASNANYSWITASQQEQAPQPQEMQSQELQQAPQQTTQEVAQPSQNEPIRASEEPVQQEEDISTENQEEQVPPWIETPKKQVQQTIQEQQSSVSKPEVTNTSTKEETVPPWEETPSQKAKKEPESKSKNKKEEKVEENKESTEPSGKGSRDLSAISIINLLKKKEDIQKRNNKYISLIEEAADTKLENDSHAHFSFLSSFDFRKPNNNLVEEDAISEISKKFLILGNDVNKTANALLKSLNNIFNTLKDQAIDSMHRGLAVRDRDTKEINKAIGSRVALASVAWFYDSADFVGNPKDEDRDIAEKLGINKEDITPELKHAYTRGIAIDFASSELVRRMKHVLGISVNEDALPDRADGIIASLADTVLTLFANRRYFTIQYINTSPFENRPDLGKTFIFLIPNQELISKFKNRYKSLKYLSNILGDEEARNDFFEDDIPSVDKKMMHTDVNLHKNQYKANEKANAQSYRQYQPMADIVFRLGEDGVVELFGTSIDPNVPHNESWRMSRESSNLNLRNSFKALERDNEVIEQVAKEKGIPKDQVRKHYKIGITKVGRIQEREPYGPVASKLTREVMVPSIVNVDMTDPDIENEFYRALGQAWGVKIDKEYNQDARDKVDEIISRFENTEAYDAIANGTIDNNSVEMLRSAMQEMRVPITPLSLHAMVDYVSYMNAEDVHNVPMSIYTEADGTCNGVFYMVLGNLGYLNEDAIALLSMVGFYPGQYRSLSDAFHDPNLTKKLDAYRYLGSKKGTDAVRTFYKQFKFKPTARNSIDNIIKLLTGTDLDNFVEFARNIVKYPVLTIGYGVSASGLADKFLEAIVDKYYDYLEYIASYDGDIAQSPLYPEIQQFERLINNSAKGEWKYSFRNGIYYDTNTLIDPTTNLSKLTKKEAIKARLDPILYERLKKNFTNVIGRNFLRGVRQGLGETITDNIETLKEASKLVTEIYTIARANKIREVKRLHSKELGFGENSPIRLPRKLEREIDESLKELEPVVQTEYSNYWIPSQKRITNRSKVTYGVALNNLSRPVQVIGAIRKQGYTNIKTSATDVVPDDPGVSALPNMTILFGDAQTVVRGALDSKLNLFSNGTLSVFDGFNAPVGQVKNVSYQLNRISADVALNNNNLRRLQEVLERQYNYLKSLDSEEAANLYPRDLSNLKEFIDSIKQKADAIDKVHDQIKKFGYSTDQMGSAESPYSSENLTDKESKLSAKDIFYKLVFGNKNLTGKNENGFVPVDSAVAILFNRLINREDIKRKQGKQTYAETLRNKQTIQAFLFPVRRFLEAKGRTTKIFIGSREDINSKLKELGESALAQNATGVYLKDRDVIFVVNKGRKEEAVFGSVLHELTHAAVSANLIQGFNDVGLNLDTTLANAYKNVRKVYWDFMSINPAEIEDENTRNAIQSLQERLRGISRNSSGSQQELIAVNEFVAYAFSNRFIEDFLRNRNIPKSWREKFQAIFNKLLNIIFGTSKIPLKNMMDYLEANTTILASELQDQESVDSIYSEKLNVQHELGSLTDEEYQWAKSLVNPIREISDKFNEGSSLPEGEATLEKYKSENVGIEANAYGYHFSPEQQSLFNMTYHVFRLNQKLPSQELVDLSKVLSLAANKLKPEDFIESGDTSSEDAAKRYVYFLGVEHGANQSRDLLARRISLALISRNLQKALEKIDLKSLKIKSTGSFLRDLGNKAIDKLSPRIARITPSMNAYEAVSKIASAIQNEALRNDTNILGEVSSTPQRLASKVNDVIVNKLEQAANAVGEKIEADTKPGTLRNTALVAFNLITGKTELSELALNQTAKLSKYFPTFEGEINALMGDIFGRTKLSKGIYSLLKKSKAKIQRIRDSVSRTFATELKNSFNKLTKQQNRILYNVIGRTELGSLLINGFTTDQAIDFIADGRKLNGAIQQYMNKIQKYSHGDWMLSRINKLVDYMVEGKLSHGLLMNADAIANLLGSAYSANPTQEMIQDIDTLISLEALRRTLKNKNNDMSSLVTQREALASSLRMQSRLISLGRRNALKEPKAKFNYVKGYIPYSISSGKKLIIASDSERDNLAKRGYVRVGDYESSKGDKFGSKGYYYSEIGELGAFQQGAIQDIALTANGVNINSGKMTREVSGVIYSPYFINKYKNNPASVSQVPLVPIFNENGDIVALQRVVERSKIEEILKPETLFTDMMGVWSGRILEEYGARGFNQQVVKETYRVYKEAKDKSGFVNLFGDNVSPVIRDAVNILPAYIKEEIEALFGKGIFMVRRDMIKDIIGQRNASVTDFWTGVSNWSPAVQRRARQVAEMILGRKAMVYLKKAENGFQGLAAFARNTIVVKSAVVAYGNIISNVFSLLARGVPMWTIIKQTRKILPQIEEYSKLELKHSRLRARLTMMDENDPERLKVLAEIKNIEATFKDLKAVYPLIEAGEFSTINDLGQTSDDLDLASGRFAEYIENKVDQLPKSLQTGLKFLLLTKDTPVYQALEKATQYGDFIAKAILYQHQLENGKTKEEALDMIAEEFVDYDRLSGRGRGYLENIGVLWFWNFKLRILKTAMSMLRHNPVQSLLVLGMIGSSITAFMGTSIGFALTDNILAKLADTLGVPGLGISNLWEGPMMLPIVELFF